MNARRLPHGHTRQTVKRLIVEGLGYCCLWAFFSCFKDTLMIALRLGVTTRAVRYAKADFKAGLLKCESCKRCMRAAIERASPGASEPPAE